jgi:HK97 family phage prohead protease
MNKNKNFFPSAELRAYKGDGLTENTEQMIVEGYAIVFNSESRNLGGFTETINPDALDGALERNNDVLALYGHDYQNVLGRQSAGTLELQKDERGIKYKLNLPDTTLGRDVFTLIERGDLKGNSFGFTVKKDKWSKGEDMALRTIEEIQDLFEISIVSMPAYEATDLTKRSFDEFLAEDKVTEEVPGNITEVYPQSILKHL